MKQIYPANAIISLLPTLLPTLAEEDEVEEAAADVALASVEEEIIDVA